MAASTDLQAAAALIANAEKAALTNAQAALASCSSVLTSQLQSIDTGVGAQTRAQQVLTAYMTTLNSWATGELANMLTAYTIPSS